MQEHFIGIVADWDLAHNFSSESVFNENSFGAHKFWVSNNNWKTHIKQKFNFKPYRARSNINKLFLYNNIKINLALHCKRENCFDIDLFFFCKVNNIEYINDTYSLDYINKIALDGFIYHPKQLINIFPKVEFYTFLDNIYAVYNNNVLLVHDFVNKYLYNSSFDILSNLLISKKYSCLNDNYNILLLVFVGNEEIGFDLIKRIIHYKKIQNNIKLLIISKLSFSSFSLIW
jgi:hypothetical protein